MPQPPDLPVFITTHGVAGDVCSQHGYIGPVSWSKHLVEHHATTSVQWGQMGGRHLAVTDDGLDVPKATPVAEERQPTAFETMDARRWADEFLAIHGGKLVEGVLPEGAPLPVGVRMVGVDDMRAWFANAIMRGWDDAHPKPGTFPYEVDLELRRAREAHGPVNSLHEGYAIIKEELGEFWRQVRRWKSQGHKGRDASDRKALHELIQTAAMCQRTAEDRKLLTP